jgi:hypothetical protein
MYIATHTYMYTELEYVHNITLLATRQRKIILKFIMFLRIFQPPGQATFYVGGMAHA